ncbi:MAG: GyrI-like domain-containing protein [Anaerolineae bacterium]
MEPKIVQKEAFTVVGPKLRCKVGETGDIPQLWGQLMGRMGEIEHLIQDGNSYGVMVNFDEETEAYDYLAGFGVSEVENVPEGMVSLEIPAQTYAVFTCTMPTIGETYNAIYGEWLPQSGYEHAPTPEFELYPMSFDPENPESEFQIYIPVTK